MSSSDRAISIRNLGKNYVIQHELKHTTLGEKLVSTLRNPFQKSKCETFEALKDVSFEVKKGEVVGIIGRNGAGKSTLLKLLSRITEPTEGRIEVRGRIGSLLEVGTGFHQELTGRENIFLNGAILGMRRAEIQRQFDAIVAFAGVDKFLDTPVKRYSSGMYVRLAFAVAAHLNPEILVIDEVLAVGDGEFQRKCLGKMRDVASSGRTILFVSHQMQAVSTLCSRAVCLEAGRLKYVGSVQEAVQCYLDYKPPAGVAGTARRGGSGDLRVTQFTSDQCVYESTDTVTFEMEITVIRPVHPTYNLSIEMTNAMGLTVLHMDSRLLNKTFSGKESATVRFQIRNPRLAQGDYHVNVFLFARGGIIDRFEQAGRITISPILPYPESTGDFATHAMVYADFSIDEVASRTGEPAEALALRTE